MATYVGDDDRDLDDTGDDGYGAHPHEVDISLRFVGTDGEPRAELPVQLQTPDGFCGVERTNASGRVGFSVKPWRSYDVWIERRKVDLIGVRGEAASFELLVPLAERPVVPRGAAPHWTGSARKEFA